MNLNITWQQVVFLGGLFVSLIGGLFLLVAFGNSPIQSRNDNIVGGVGVLVLGVPVMIVGGVLMWRQERKAASELAASDRDFFAGKMPAHRGGDVIGYEAGTGSLRCPKCGCETESMKAIGVNHTVVFLIYFVWKKGVLYVCCQKCMRRIIFKRMLINLPTANILWPIIAGGHLVAIGSTYKKGHTPGVTRLFIENPGSVQLVQEKPLTA